MITSSGVGILLLTAFFFLGSQEDFLNQTDELGEYFVKRAIAGMSIGLLGCLIVVIGNFIFNAIIKKGERVNVLRIFLITLFVTSLSSIIGTSIFFFH